MPVRVSFAYGVLPLKEGFPGHFLIALWLSLKTMLRLVNSPHRFLCLFQGW